MTSPHPMPRPIPPAATPPSRDRAAFWRATAAHAEGRAALWCWAIARACQPRSSAT